MEIMSALTLCLIFFFILRFFFLPFFLQVAHAPELEATFSASRDKTIRMWKRGTTDGGTVELCNCKQTFSGHDLVVTGVDFGWFDLPNF